MEIGCGIFRSLIGDKQGRREGGDDDGEFKVECSIS
jgi:hypothetical protein